MTHKLAEPDMENWFLHQATLICCCCIRQGEKELYISVRVMLC